MDPIGIIIIFGIKSHTEYLLCRDEKLTSLPFFSLFSSWHLGLTPEVLPLRIHQSITRPPSKVSSQSLAINTSRQMEKPPDNGIIENNDQVDLSPPPQETGSVNALDHMSSPPSDSFDPGWSFYTSFTSLCIITLAVALDATSLSIALPVIAPSYNNQCMKTLQNY